MPALSRAALALCLAATLTPPARAGAPAEGAGLADANGDPLPEGAVARLGTVRLRHSGEVHSVAVSPDGALVASAATWDSCVWDAAIGRPLERFRGMPRAEVVAFAPDGKTLLAGDRDGTVRHYDVATGTLRPEDRPGTRAGFQGLVAKFSPDGKVLALTDHGTNGLLVDAASGTPLLRLSKQGAVQSIAVAPGGKTVATGGRDGAVRLWDAAGGGELRALATPGDWVADVGFSPDGRALAAATAQGLRVWETASGKVLLDASRGGQTLAFSPDGRTLAVAAGNAISLWDVPSRSRAGELRGHGSWVVPALAFSADGRRLVSGGRDHTVIVWDLAAGRPLHSLPGHRGAVIALAFAPDGRSLASGGDEDRALVVWDVPTARPRFAVPHRDWVAALAFAPDSRTLASGEGSNGTTDREAKVRVVDAATGRVRHQFFAHLNSVGSLAFAPDGAALATSGWDARVRVWDPATGRRLHEFRVADTPAKRLAFSADGRTLVAAEPGAARGPSWRLDTGAPLGEADAAAPEPPGGPDRHRGGGVAARSPDGTLWAVAGQSAREVELYEAGAARPFARLGGHTGMVVSLAFAPDGKTMASGSWDTTALLWDVSRLRLIAPWSGLDGEDPGRAARALAAAPGAVAFLRETLLRAADRERAYAGLIAALDADRFEDRDRAARSLAAAGRDAGFALAMAAEGHPSAEVRRRARQALDRLAAGAEAAVARLAALAEGGGPEVGKALQEVAALGRDAVAPLRRRLAAGARPGPPRPAGSGTSPRERAVLEEALRLAAGPEVVRVDFSPVLVRRGFEVLGRVGTPEAQQGMRELAGGPPGAGVTRLARAALAGTAAPPP